MAIKKQSNSKYTYMNKLKIYYYVKKQEATFPEVRIEVCRVDWYNVWDLLSNILAKKREGGGRKQR